MRNISVGLIILFAMSFGGAINAGTAFTSEGQPVPGQFIVKLSPSARPSLLRSSLASDERLGPVSQLSINPDLENSTDWSSWQIFRSDRTDLTVQDVIGKLGAQNVVHVEPDYYLQFFDYPEDAYFDSLWHLRNTGQGYPGVERFDGANNDLRVVKSGTPGWDVGMNSLFSNPPAEATRVVVAIVDSGTDPTHPELAGRYWHNPDEIPGNGIDDDHNGFVDDTLGYDVSGDSIAFFGIEGDNDPTDIVGHGTHIAGIIGGAANSIGIVGIASNVEIMSVKIRPNATNSVGAAGIIYAINAGAQIINLSWGTPFQSAVLHEAMQIARANGVFVSVAAGNSSGNDEFYPAAFDSVFSVAAGNSSGFLTSFTTWGPAIDIVAPGEDILSLRASGTDMYAQIGEPNVHIVGPDDLYYLADGTSMAAPVVSGAAALLWSIRPDLSLDGLENILRLGARDIVDPWNQGDSLPGPDTVGGWGYLSIESSLNLVLEGGLYFAAPPPKSRYVDEVAIRIAPIAGYEGSYLLEYRLSQPDGEWLHLASGGSVPSDSIAVTLSAGDPNGTYQLRLTDDNGRQRYVSFVFVSENHVAMDFPYSGEEYEYSIPVVGSAYGPDLDSVQVSYFDQDFVGELLWTSSGEYFDSLIYAWNASGLAPGNYSVTLIGFFGPLTMGDTADISIESAFAAGWPQKLTGRGSYSPACGDLNGDGIKEIVVGTTFGLNVFHADGTPVDGFPFLPNYDCRCVPAIYDIDRDGKNEIIISNSIGVFGINYDGSLALGWPRLWSSNSVSFGYAQPTITKLGQAEDSAIVMITEEGTILAYRLTGDPYFFSLGGYYTSFNRFPTSSFFFGGNAVTSTDLNGDGLYEVVASHSASSRVAGVALFDGRTAENAWDRPEPYVDSMEVVYGTMLADLNNDNLPEIVTVGYDGTGLRRVWAKTMGVLDLPGWPISLPEVYGYRGSHPTIADLDLDGSPEILFTFFEFDVSSLYVFRADGSPYMQLDGQPAGEIYSDPSTFGSPIVANLTGDEYPEIILRSGYILPGTGPEQLHLIDHTGIPVDGWPISTPARSTQVFSTPFVPLADDIDGDGLMELLLIGEADEVYIWNFDASSDNGNNVGRLFGDNCNSSIYHNFSSPTGVDEADETLPTQFVLNQNYPNPFNPSTRIEFSIGERSHVSLTVYNVLGRHVASLVDNMLRPGNYSVAFDGTDLSSGTYFYRLEAGDSVYSRKMLLLK